MNINYNEVIECGNKLYYDINSNSKLDVPSHFFEVLEGYWTKWKVSNSKLSFYDYCKSLIKK